MHRTPLLILACLAVAASLAAPAAAAVADVPTGSTVFVGEQGLNITATGIAPGGQIARFGAGGNIQTDAPSDVMAVSDPTSFYVAPGTFATATGAWYTWPGRQLAFIVKDPTLQVRVINTRTGREPGSGFVSGDPLGFRVETNLYSMAQRPGVAGAPITIHVRDPTGAEFTSLEGPTGITTSLVDIPVNSSVYETGPVWTTDTARYRAGSYEVWADCNANGIKDNYNVVGKTTTRSQSGTVQVGGTTGPSITGAGTPTATVTTTGTTTPNTTTPTMTVSATVTVSTETPAANATTPAATATTAQPSTTRSPGFDGATVAFAALVGLGLLLVRRT